MYAYYTIKNYLIKHEQNKDLVKNKNITSNMLKELVERLPGNTIPRLYRIRI
jgi:hypothetical protein